MNDEIIRNTIVKMREAGLTDSIIGSTLSDLGLSAGQVQAYLAGAGAPSSSTPSSASSSFSFRPASAYAAPAPPAAAPSARTENKYASSAVQPPYTHASATSEINHDVLASRTSDKVVQRLDERDALINEETDLKDSITHLALEQHGQQLQDTHQAVMDLHEKFDGTALDTISNRVTQLNAKMNQFSNDLGETKALAGALQSLMQKILEANQQLLFEIKNKNK